ncbi:MAG: Tyrosine-specific transport protein [Chlamydiae bacterium]|nr:Tyrosine-specific transport protein [Chlamydiota bacterium]
MKSNDVSQSRVFGAILLITGCCIGAGMLGLPPLTAAGGFKPTIILFVLSWLFMASTGLLLLEVNLWFSEEVSIVTMAGFTLGKIGKVLGWVLFAFLFYSLMVAFSAGSGQLCADFVEETVGITIPEWVGGLVLSLLFGVFLYMGTQTVDRINRLLMVCLVGTYFALVGIGSGHVNRGFLQHVDWGAATVAIPAMIISFGYHNLIPSLTTYLKHDVKKLRLSILVGSSIPLLIYLMWEWLMLGLIPLDGEGGLQQAVSEGTMATRLLRNAVGASWIVDLAEYFAFFAIVTTFLSVALGFVDFLADGLHVKKDGKGKVLLCTLSLAPPFLFSLIYPKIFLMALSYAGAFGAVILFGILPAAMVWSGRYVKQLGHKPLVPGGRLTLIVVILASLGVVTLEIIHQFQ